MRSGAPCWVAGAALGAITPKRNAPKIGWMPISLLASADSMMPASRIGSTAGSETVPIHLEVLRRALPGADYVRARAADGAAVDEFVARVTG